MRQTLFFIPHELAGIPVFGFGWLLGVTIMLALVVMIYTVRTHGWSQDAVSSLMFFGLVGAIIALVLPAVEVTVQGHEQQFMLSTYEPASGEALKGLPIRGYGMFLLAATVSGVMLARHRAMQLGLHPDVIYNLAFYMFVGGILGARVFLSSSTGMKSMTPVRWSIRSKKW